MSQPFRECTKESRSNFDSAVQRQTAVMDFVRSLQMKHVDSEHFRQQPDRQIGPGGTALAANDLLLEVHANQWSTIFEQSEQSHCSLATQRVSQARLFSRRIVTNPVFEACCAVAILLNTASIGLAADQAARLSNPESIPPFHSAATKCFSSWFFCELTLRLVAYGREFFTSGERGWNIFDLLVVAVDVVILISEGNQFSSLLRSLRALRITRTVRVFRLIRFVRELRMMIHSVIKSGHLLVWSLLLFFSVSYIFAVYIMANVTSHLYASGPNAEHATEMKQRFGSLDRALYTLFITVFSGISWFEISDLLLDIHWTNALFFCFYVFFVSIAVMNIVTGIFVDSAINSARCDQEEVIQEQLHNEKSSIATLRRIFEEADADASGYITKGEFDTHMKAAQTKAQFASLNINVAEARRFFRLLDTDNSESICINEFIHGCMRMKGNASGIDVATLLYENKRMVRIITSYAKETQGNFERIMAWQSDILDLCSKFLGIGSQTAEHRREETQQL